MMNTDFWRIVEDARKGKGASDVEVFLSRVRGLFEKMPAPEIVAFKAEMQRQLSRAYTWKLWGAAYLINGGCSDDMFEYWRCWLIAQGKDVFDRAVADPDWLHTLGLPFDDEGFMDYEGFLYLPAEVYEEKTGGELPREAYPEGRKEPEGEPWEDEELPELLPKLAALYGGEDE